MPNPGQTAAQRTGPEPTFMKPTHKLAEAATPEGRTLTLTEHDGAYCIRINGEILMHSQTSASERLLGQMGCARLSESAKPRLLIGGLGLGFTLKAVLEALGSGARVEVAELLPEVIEWNRQFLSELNGSVLEDPRVHPRAEDVVKTLERANRGTYDAILLDIDNGPTAMVQKVNARLYDRRGLKRLAKALKPCGRLAVWSASRDTMFEERLTLSGFEIEVVPAKLHPNAKRASCILYSADLIRRRPPPSAPL